MVGYASVACADAASSGPLPALASGIPCGLIGDCARFGALGSTFGIEQNHSQKRL
jgi:hypothetical protein